jgi:glycosyltransferase involved in cell wall biosynthesis
MNKELTVIVPAFNEGTGIGLTLQLLKAKAEINHWDIIVVNDGSGDNTEEEVLTLGDGITLISHPYNKGYGAALKTGIRAASTKYIALYDSDGQHNPDDLEALWKNIGQHDMIVGLRGKDSHQDWMRKPGKWLLSKTANFLTGKKIPDLNSGLRIIRRDAIISKLHLLSDTFSFSTTSTVALMNMGHFVDYYPIKVKKRIGKSSVRQLKHGSRTIMLILRLIVLFNPLKVFMPVSVILFLIGVIYEVLFGIILMPGGLKLIPAALLLILTGIFIFFFGLIADQLSEIRKHNLFTDGTR